VTPQQARRQPGAAGNTSSDVLVRALDGSEGT